MAVKCASTLEKLVIRETCFTKPCPIEALPPEIIGHIIECTTGPEDTRQVLRLSHVSPKWNAICLSHSRLFTHADWARWAPELLQLWCKHAKYRSLSIQINEKDTFPFSNALSDEAGKLGKKFSQSQRDYEKRLLEALRQAVPHAESLEIQSYERPHHTILLVRDLLAQARPHLRRLKLGFPDEDRSPVDPPLVILCPDLRWLSVSGIHIQSELPLLELSTLEFHDIFHEGPEAAWSTLYGSILAFCVAVKNLSITFSGNTMIIGPKIPLPHVQKLSLHQGEYLGNWIPYKSILGLLQFPNLEELSLEANELSSTGFLDTLAALPVSISHFHIRSISFREAVTLPLMVMTKLLSSSYGSLLAPRLRHVGCWLVTPEDRVWRQDIPSLPARPDQLELEEIVLKVLAQRKLVQVQLVVVSTACIELAASYGTKVNVRISILSAWFCLLV
ncbi:hypothetical protein DL93DRAFT_1836037 [Clavulina sp. PMI_390]|nr:hypothetical protein DL93DRAFT_1836037 [Clavulina sp. PMI_390]